MPNIPDDTDPEPRARYGPQLPLLCEECDEPIDRLAPGWIRVDPDTVTDRRRREQPLHDRPHPIPEIPPRSSDFLDNRGAYWEQLRDLGRVVIDSSGPGSTVYYLTRRDDVLAALRDPEAFRPDFGTFELVTKADGQPIREVPRSFTPQEHARAARNLYAPFTPKALAPFAEAIRAHARDLIATVAPTGRCEAVHDDFTIRLFTQGTLLTVFGIGHEHLSEIATLMSDPAVDYDSSLQARLLHCMRTGLASGYRRRPGILWDLIDSVDSSDSLSREEFFGLILSLKSASQSTIDAIQFALLRLARDPHLRRRLCENPELASPFVEEIIRIETSTVRVARVTTREVTIGDCTIAPNTTVILCLESASREDGGDEFSITSDRRRHWGFGGGIHRCLGSHLARLEMTTFVREWLRQIPELELEPGFRPAIGEEEVQLTALRLRWDTK